MSGCGVSLIVNRIAAHIIIAPVIMLGMQSNWAYSVVICYNYVIHSFCSYSTCTICMLGIELID